MENQWQVHNFYPASRQNKYDVINSHLDHTTLSSENRTDKDTSFVVEKIANVVKASSGKISIKLKDKTAIELDFGGDTVIVDIVEPKILGMADELESDVGLFEMLRRARRVGKILNNNDLSISILRKGKKALSIGRKATPSISSLITRSDDIQIDSFTQVAKLDRDINRANENKWNEKIT